MNRNCGIICIIATMLVGAIVTALLALPMAIAQHETSTEARDLCVALLVASTALSAYLMFKQKS